VKNFSALVGIMREMNKEKRRERAKSKKKRANLRRNAPKVRYKLEVFQDGDWRPALEFRTKEEMRGHCDETEKLRERGDQLIVPGKILNRRGEVVRHIEGYEPPGTPRQITPERVIESSPLIGPMQPGFQGLRGQMVSDLIKDDHAHWGRGQKPLM